MWLRRILMVLAFALAIVPLAASAGSVWVNGYYRSDGTYVRGHYRSAPDGQKWNNYGPAQSESERFNPYSRDFDNDGLSNQFDMDDDNDLMYDNWDNNQYRD